MGQPRHLTMLALAALIPGCDRLFSIDLVELNGSSIVDAPGVASDTAADTANSTDSPADAHADSVVLDAPSDGMVPLDAPVDSTALVDILEFTEYPALWSSDICEGDTVEGRAALLAAPTGTIVVSLSSSKPASVVVSPTSMSFDASNWNSPRAFIVTGNQATTTGDALITLSSPGAVPKSRQIGVLDVQFCN